MTSGGCPFFLPPEPFQGANIYDYIPGFQEGTMKPSRSGTEFGTTRMIERQMLLVNAREKMVRDIRSDSPSLRYRFLTISRDKGSLGDQISQELGKRLGWQVFDREILDYIAQNSHVRQGLVEQLDEKSQSLVHDTIQRFLRLAEGGSFGIAEYYGALVKTLAYLATRGEAILMGRGSNFVTREEKLGLHVRIVASPMVRVQRLSERWRIPPAEACWRMKELDTQRRAFVRHHFAQNIDDPRFYDLIYSTDHLTAEQVVDSLMGVIRMPARKIEQSQLVPAGVVAASADSRTA